jgi:CheY-like chemotaxis protein
VVLRGIEMATPLLEQRRQHTDVQVAPLGLAVEGDRDRLAQVVSNLLTNASKYSEPETTIHIAAETVGERVRLRVRDEGIGMPPEMLERAFDLFFQQPQAIDRAKGGLGLGLTIVRSLVELHGGTVVASSAGPGQGSEFVVELPLAAEAGAVSSASTAAPSVRIPLNDLSSGGGTRVLVVDDNLDVAESIAELLREMGWQVQLAGDGPEALRVAARFRPEVCLVDIGLPVMDGYELAQKLRAAGSLAPGARLIAVTGYGQDSDRARSREAGFDLHLVKPVKSEVLIEAVGAYRRP